MSVEMTKLSGALAEWSKWQYNATEASQVLSKAMTGEVEQLKTMGVVIDQSSKEFGARIKALMKTKKLTLQQAKAEDILQQIISKSTDAQKSFTKG